MPKIEVYTQPFCPFCSRVTALLTKKDVPFQEINAPHGSEQRAQAVQRAGRSTMPQIFIDSTHVGGCDDLMALERTGKLDALLGR